MRPSRCPAPVKHPDNPFLFLGGLGYWQEPNLGSGGLTYVRARWLDTGTGQWISVDPVDGEPRYSYAHQSPTLLTDASGTQGDGGFFSARDEELIRTLLAPVRTGARDIVRGIKSATGVDLSPHHIAATVEPLYRRKAESFVGKWQAFQSLYQKYIVPGMPLVGLRFTDNLEEASYKGMVNDVPKPFNSYLPPYYKTPQIVPYAAGFLWGALGSVYHMFFEDPITALNKAKEAALDAYRTMLYVVELASTPEFWNYLGPIIKDFFGHLVPELPASMPLYDRGKRAGILLVNIVMLILTVIDLMNLPSVIMGLFKNMKGLFTALRNAGGLVQKFLGDGKAVEAVQQLLRGFGKLDKDAILKSPQKYWENVRARVNRAVERVRTKGGEQLRQQPQQQHGQGRTIKQEGHILGGIPKNSLTYLLYEDGSMELLYEAPPEAWKIGGKSGSTMFDEMMQAVGPEKIERFDARFIETNRDLIEEGLAAHESLEQAVRRTKTFKWAERYGFKNVASAERVVNAKGKVSYDAIITR